MPYQEPGNEFSDDVRDMHRAIESLKEEPEAIDWYNQRVGVCAEGIQAEGQPS